MPHPPTRIQPDREHRCDDRPRERAIGVLGDCPRTTVGDGLRCMTDVPVTNARDLEQESPWSGCRPPATWDHLIASDGTLPCLPSSAAFDLQVRSVRSDRQIEAYAHWVIPHVRTLTFDTPDPEYVAEAHLRSRMRPEDTWLRGHERYADDRSRALQRLQAHSAMADAIGSAATEELTSRRPGASNPALPILVIPF
jgi:hypothetical protein